MTFHVLALALLVRTFPAVDGQVSCPLEPGQRVIDAYSAEYEPIWHHGVWTTIVDRVEAVRTGRVTGLGPADRLVLAVADERATFDATKPVKGPVDVFPFSDELVAAYRKRTGRDYVRDMMTVVAPNLGNQWNRLVSVSDMYETLFALDPARRDVVRAFGFESGRRVLVVSSRARSWCWLDPCFGDDGADYAQKLAAKGCRVGLSGSEVLSDLALDADGWIVLNGIRYETVVLRHLSSHDGECYRRTFRTAMTGANRRTVRTKIYATDAPILFGTEIVWSDPDL